MRKELLNLILIILVISCSQKVTELPTFEGDIRTEIQEEEGNVSSKLSLYQFDREKISLHGQMGSFTPHYSVHEIDSFIYLIKFQIESDFPAIPPQFKMKLAFPRKDIYTLWSSETWSNNSYFNLPNYDKAATPYGIVSAITKEDKNRFTYTCKDDNNDKFLALFVEEKVDTMYFNLNFFVDNPPVTNILDYDAEIRIDLRNVNYVEAIADAASWRIEQKIGRMGDERIKMREPIYSSWYPMHRNIPVENLTREMDSIASYGFKSLLIDDGWQSLVKSKIDTLGNWDAGEVEDMFHFIDKGKEKGFQVYLWYSLPFTGGNPKVLKRFKDKFVRYRAPRQIYVIDPRYPDVRSYLIDVYSNMLEKWNIDGFWFDFINDYYPDENVVLKKDMGRDLIGVFKAVDTLLVEIKNELKFIHPDVFFGQNLHAAGPARSNYQSSLTGFVGVQSAGIVREKMVNNRLLFGRYTPFMEIMGIDAEDTPEQVALKFQSILFEIPHLSFFPMTISPSVHSTLHFWLDYWRYNKQLLLDGTFRPLKPAKGYPVIQCSKNNKTLFVNYDALQIIELPREMPETLDIINSTTKNYLQISHFPDESQLRYEVYDATGKMRSSGIYKLKKPDHEFIVPPAGLLRFKRTN
ncbi:hypothetical protein EMN47_19025 [Prolixibacteraceae bacterium JC049]|nr:hypothetical protein [Prolixibacteraceae bacterium JC049]